MCPIFDTGCLVTTAANTAVQVMGTEAGKAAATNIGEAMTFWVDTPSIDPASPAVRTLQGYTVPIAGLILVISVLAQSVKMMLSRKKDPLLNIAVGLARYAVATAVGLALLAAALQAVDELSQSLVDRGLADYAERMQGLFTAQVQSNPFGVLLLAVVAWVLGALQWLLAFIRQAGILVLAAMLSIAAAGSINESTKGWLTKLTSWLAALVAYKLMAAMIYTIGFTLMGAGQDFATLLTGVMVMVLAALALPAMMRFFSWSGLAASSGVGVGGAVATGVAVGAAVRGGFGDRDGSSAAQAAQQRMGSGAGSTTAGQLALPGGAAATGGGGSVGSPSPTPGGAAAGGAGTAAAGGRAARAASAAAGPVGAAAAAGHAAYQAGQAATRAAANTATSDGPTGSGPTNGVSGGTSNGPSGSGPPTPPSPGGGLGDGGQRP
jgi:hypothetical protein